MSDTCWQVLKCWQKLASPHRTLGLQNVYTWLKKLWYKNWLCVHSHVIKTYISYTKYCKRILHTLYKLMRKDLRSYIWIFREDGRNSQCFFSRYFSAYSVRDYTLPIQTFSDNYHRNMCFLGYHWNLEATKNILSVIARHQLSYLLRTKYCRLTAKRLRGTGKSYFRN